MIVLTAIDIGKAARWSASSGEREFRFCESRDMTDPHRYLLKSEFPKFLVLDFGYSDVGIRVLKILLSNGRVGWVYSNWNGSVEAVVTSP